MTEQDPGVPEALPRAVRCLADHVSPESVDRLWIFPALKKGRRENGVLAAGCFTGGERRLLVTVAYRAEETGKGVTFEHVFQEEGEAPEDRLPRVMEGVVQRFGEAPGSPRPVLVGGDPKTLEALLEELDPEPSGLTSSPARNPGSAEEMST